MKKYEFTGKKLDTTIEEALKTLNKKQEDVDINIITEGGLFKKCKIEIIVEDDTPQETISQEASSEEIVNEEVAQEETNQTTSVNETTLTSFETDEVVEDSVIVENSETEDNVKEINSSTIEEKLAKQQELQAEREKKYANKDNATYAKEFIENLLKNMGIENAEISQEDTLESSIIHINCENNAQIIGYKGEALRNIQYIANLVEQRKNNNSKRVVINVGDYNTRHAEKIKELARKKAEKVLKFRRRIKLDPMNAYDRHLVHEELSKMENITTHSEGVEPNRRLVIEYIK